MRSLCVPASLWIEDLAQKICPWAALEFVNLPGDHKSILLRLAKQKNKKNASTKGIKFQVRRATIKTLQRY